MYWQFEYMNKRDRAWAIGFLVFICVFVAAGFLILLLGPIAIWATPIAGLRGIDRANALNATRQTLLAGTGGIVVLAGAIFTGRTYYLGRRGQLTDRYAKAIALLASDKITERIGGVYALEHLMIESEREHETVIEVIAAFVREHAGASTTDDRDRRAEHHHKDGDGTPRVGTDVHAALTVIGRRPQRHEREDLVDLSCTDLCGADLSNLKLDKVSLWGAKLRSAKMLGTSLKGANLSWAQLHEAKLTDAQMQGTYMIGTQLKKAVLIRAQLQRADLEEAHLEGAYLAGANLKDTELKDAYLQGADLINYPIGKPYPQSVRGLTVSQLADAIIDDSTQLPDGLREARSALAPRSEDAADRSANDPG